MTPHHCYKVKQGIDLKAVLVLCENCVCMVVMSMTVELPSIRIFDRSQLS